MFNNEIEKGKFGEDYVGIILSNFGYPSMYCKDVLIEFDNGTLTQIDNILITKSGVHIIEMKNYSGHIKGVSSHNYWRYNSKYSFYNPIKQNTTHRQALQHILGSRKFTSIIVFGDDCRLDITNYSQAKVINIKDLEKTIKQDKSDIYTEHTIIEIWNTIMKKDLSNNKEKVEEHLRQVKSKSL